MINQVASAIAKYFGHDGPGGFEDVAKLAINAMQEPTEAMVDAAFHAEDNMDAESIFRAMIGNALMSPSDNKD